MAMAMAMATMAGPVAATQAATLPAGFTDEAVANVGAPTALAFTPDGRMLVATQPGVLRVLTPAGALLATPRSTSPPGPARTPSAACSASRSIRRSRAIASSTSPPGNHNAGDPKFGKDGNLYVSVGDGGCEYAGGGCAGANDAARDEHVLTGKILRVTPSGGIPADNRSRASAPRAARDRPHERRNAPSTA